MPTNVTRIGLFFLRGLGFLLVVGLVAVFLFPQSRNLYTGEARPVSGSANGPSQMLDSSEAAEPSNRVKLAPEELAVSGIRTAPVERVPISETVTISGTVEADPNHQVEIRPRVIGVIRSVAVELGDQVNAGDHLVTLDSVEVGNLRLDYNEHVRNVALKETELEWENTVAENVEALSKSLVDGETIDLKSIEESFEGKPIGDERAMLLAAFADLEAARLEEVRLSNLVSNEILGKPKAQLAQQLRIAAQAKFDAALEQIRYEARRNRRVAELGLLQSKADLRTVSQRLAILGIRVDNRESQEWLSTSDPSRIAQQDLTAYSLSSPISGTIVATSAVPSHRVSPSDRLMKIVDMSQLHVDAYIPESLFGYLPEQGEELEFTAGAYPSRRFQATVHSVGAEIDPETRTVSIHSEFSDPDQLLRLGMYVTIRLTDRNEVSVLGVPASAVVQIDGKRGVFVRSDEPNSFEFRLVTLGDYSGDFRAVRSGLEEHQEVVVEGAFLLKSELVLQNEPEEE